MTILKVIIRGRTERQEFQEPFLQSIKMLKEIGAVCEINSAYSQEPVDVVLFFQSYPHEFLSADLLQFRHDNPLAPFFFVLGTCCEGMLRTAGARTIPFNGPFYCYVHAWNSTKTEQIRRFLTDQPSEFSVPMTAENDEIALMRNPYCSSVRIAAKSPVSQENCWILTRFEHFGNDSVMNQFLADEQRRFGYEPVMSEKLLETPFSGKILADADDAPTEKISESIQRLRQRFADNDFTVYVDSPRINEKEDYIRAGATRILPKMRFD